MYGTYSALHVISVEGDSITIKCTNIHEDYENAKSHLAVYDDEGAFVANYMKDAAETVVFEDIANGAVIKVFAWDENMEPIYEKFITKK